MKLNSPKQKKNNIESKSRKISTHVPYKNNFEYNDLKFPIKTQRLVECIISQIFSCLQKPILPLRAEPLSE